MANALALRDDKGRFLKGSKPPAGMQRKGGLACVRNNGNDYMAEIGRRGFQNAIAAHGAEEILGKVQEWRASNPTDLEKIVAGWLEEMGVEFVRHHLVLSYYLDFAFPKHKMGIEADGEYWHSREGRAHGQSWDEKRNAELRAEGWTVLRLSEAEIRSGEGKERLVTFLAEKDTWIVEGGDDEVLF